MKIAVLKEKVVGEKRVAIHPDVVKKFVSKKIEICIEQGAGLESCVLDSAFIDAGARISKIPLEIIADADIVLKLYPTPNSKDNLSELELMKEGSILVSMLNPSQNKDLLYELLHQYAKKKINVFAMELIPRISRAQSMDVLSSQSNLAGYKSVLDAASEFGKVFPMMMTAAGTVPAAKVLVLGAGVAGLQAIATAKRLGAVVSAFDVRSAAKEQVESLGAKFIQVQDQIDGSLKSGYAKEMSDEYKLKQANLIKQAAKNHDIIISTALIPGKIAPILLTKDMVEIMQPGSVIVDLAAISGGNCELTKLDKVIVHSGVKIIGYGNVASRLAAEASRLYSKNLQYFVELLLDKNDSNKINIDLNDEIIKGCLLTYNGTIVHPNFQGD